MERNWRDISKARNFLIEPCKESENKACVSIRSGESSSPHYGPRMFPLLRLPRGRPKWNAARLIFSRWEKGGKTRTCDTQAMKDFYESQRMICDENGPCSAMSAHERKQWVDYFAKINEEQHLLAESVSPDYWIPETRAHVEAHLKSIAKPKTPDEIHAGKT